MSKIHHDVRDCLYGFVEFGYLFVASELKDKARVKIETRLNELLAAAPAELLPEQAI